MRTSTMAQWAIRGVVVVLQVEVRGCWQRFMHRPAGFVSRDTGLPPPQFWANNPNARLAQLQSASTAPLDFAWIAAASDATAA
jgi:hypothetical protein